MMKPRDKKIYIKNLYTDKLETRYSIKSIMQSTLLTLSTLILVSNRIRIENDEIQKKERKKRDEIGNKD